MLRRRYLWLTGKVNMKAVEVTIQNLIGSGMDPKTENNPYLGFIYTSFQERATKVAHGNTARFAKEHGDDVLSKARSAAARRLHARFRRALCCADVRFRPNSDLRPHRRGRGAA